MPQAIAEPKFSPDATSVPVQAMQFDCGGELKFAAVTEGDVTTAPISMLGRSAEPINHWYWGAIVHDMAGFSTDHSKVPIDWCHDDEVVLGYLDKFTADNKGLNVSGKLISFSGNPPDRAAKLMKESAVGIPYQASIFFRADRLEYVPEGFSTSVNGYQLSGPAIVVREWGLRGMAVCLYGADHRTQSKFSDGDQIPVTIFSSETSMSKGKPANETIETKPTQLTETKPAETKPADVPTQLSEKPATEVPVQLTAKDARAELKQFVTAFGSELGASCFTEGLSFADAQTKFVGTLQEKLAAKDKEIEELKTKLSSIDRGADQPLSFSSPDAPQNQQPNEFAHLGDNMSKFASGLKLPAGK